MLKTMAERMDKTHRGLTTEETVFIDPASIVLYISIITEVVQLAKKCYDAKKATEASAQPTRWQQAVVKRIVRKNIGWKAFFAQGPSLIRSVFDVGKNSTVEEMEELYREV